MPSPRLSACMIVQDEARRLGGALESLAFCDEVVVVDGGSTDRTVELARSLGAKVVENPWPGFAAQRNVALDRATGEWVLEIDADERVSPELRTGIERFLSSGDRSASIAVCALRNRFLGGSLGPSAKYPAYRSRLFRRGAYRHDESRQVHEGIEPHERPFVLSGDLEHELADTWREALADAWRYARLESAHIRAPRNPLAYTVGILLRPSAKLAYRLILDGGWRDGWRGTVKVLLDAGSDALVWVLVLVGAGGTGRASKREERNEAGPLGEAPARHFGRRPSGEPKVVALAGPGAPAERARTWLGELARAGIDVALVGQVQTDRLDGRQEPDEVQGQALERLTPLRAMRALDLEMQIRTAHAVVPFGWRAKLVHRVLPRALRPAVPGLDAAVEPSVGAERLREAVRSSG